MIFRLWLQYPILHVRIRMLYLESVLKKNQLFSSACIGIVICIRLLNHKIAGFGGPIWNMSVNYFKKEVTKIYLYSFENIQNSRTNPAIFWFNNGIQMTTPLVQDLYGISHHNLIGISDNNNKKIFYTDFIVVQKTASNRCKSVKNAS